MKRRRNITHEEGPGTVYRSCPVCQKRRVEVVGFFSDDGKRWYCSSACLRRGERTHQGNG